MASNPWSVVTPFWVTLMSIWTPDSASIAFVTCDSAVTAFSEVMLLAEVAADPHALATTARAMGAKYLIFKIFIMESLRAMQLLRTPSSLRCLN